MSNIKIDLSQAQYFTNWLSSKLFLDSIAKSASKRNVKRGEVYWCNFGYNIGSEMRKTTPRPCVILQSDNINSKSPNTIVCPITHNSKSLPCMIPIGIHTDINNNVILDGKANVASIVCISKARLGNKILQNRLSKKIIHEIDLAILKQIDIMPKYKKLLDKCDKQNIKIQDLFKKNSVLKNQLQQLFEIYEVDDYDDLLTKIKLAQKSIDKP